MVCIQNAFSIAVCVSAVLEDNEMRVFIVLTIFLNSEHFSKVVSHDRRSLLLQIWPWPPRPAFPWLGWNSGCLEYTVECLVWGHWLFLPPTPAHKFSLPPAYDCEVVAYIPQVLAPLGAFVIFKFVRYLFLFNPLCLSFGATFVCVVDCLWLWLFGP